MMFSQTSVRVFDHIVYGSNIAFLTFMSEADNASELAACYADHAEETQFP